VAETFDDILEMIVLSLGIEIQHVKTGSFVTSILHTGCERLTEGFPQKGNHFGVDVYFHNNYLLLKLSVMISYPATAGSGS
jgi:hypothetical protein